MTLQLRPACVADIPGVYRGEQEYIRCWEPTHEEAWRAQTERHLTCWVENFERLTIATLDEQFAGYALWIPEEGRAVLCTINVGEAYRRKGIGRALLDAYARDAQRRGFKHLTLSVRPDNPARWMYEQAGFVCIGTDTHNYLKYERIG